jgi:hypothetical protein
LIGLLGFSAAEVTEIEAEIAPAIASTPSAKISDLAVKLHTLIC